MNNLSNENNYSNRLLFFGALLFLIGLAIGLLIPIMKNPRMGLSAHLEGAMNGMFLMILGVIWNKLVLSNKWQKTAYWLFVYGSFANFTAVTIAAVTGAGKVMPIAGGKEGNSMVDGFISFLLLSLSLAMIVACSIVVSGIYRYMKNN
jgi:hydroxylaminobenzene mutase